MNVERILKEMDSEAMQEVVKTIWETVDRVQSKRIDLDNGHFELMGCKHILQAFAISLAREQFNKNSGTITKKAELIKNGNTIETKSNGHKTVRKNDGISILSRLNK